MKIEVPVIMGYAVLHKIENVVTLNVNIPARYIEFEKDKLIFKDDRDN